MQIPSENILLLVGQVKCSGGRASCPWVENLEALLHPRSTRSKKASIASENSVGNRAREEMFYAVLPGLQKRFEKYLTKWLSGLAQVLLDRKVLEWFVQHL